MRVGGSGTQNIVLRTVTVQNMLRAVTCLLVDQELALLSLNLLLNLLCTLVILLIVGIHTLKLRLLFLFELFLEDIIEIFLLFER